MIKRNNFLVFILFSIVLHNSNAETNDQLFNKVFGATKNSKRIILPLYFKDKNLGEVSVDLLGDQIVGIPANQFINVAKNILQKKVLERIIKLKKEIYTIEDFEFELKYDPADLKIELVASDELIKPTDSLFQESLIPYFAKDALTPAELSGAINLKLEKSFSHKDVTGDYFASSFSSFLNLNSYVLENLTQYDSNREQNKWYRGNTTITKDFESISSRLIMGDVSSLGYGYLTSQSLAGLSFNRDYSITPYKLTTPSVSQEFKVDSRSVVRYYVNNQLLKTEFLNAGKYNIKDIPLYNGINRIIVEVEDEFGNKKFYNFNESFSSEMLREGDVKYDISIGKSSSEQNFKKTYESGSKILSSAFFKRGWSDKYTSGFYFQNKSNFSLIGNENLFSSKIGNWGLGLANSKHGDYQGMVYSVNYFLSSFLNILGNNQTLNLKLEKRNKNFNEGLEYVASKYEYNFYANYTLPIWDWASLGIGNSLSVPYDKTLNTKLGIDLSLTGRAFKNATLTLFASNFKNEYKKWNQYYYLFLNFSLDDNTSFISSFYDSNSHSKKISYSYDKAESFNNVKVLASVEDGRFNRTGDVDIAYEAKYSELGLRETVSRLSDNKYGGRSNIRAISALSFAKKEDQLKFGFSRSLANSFAIISGNELLKGQKLALKSSGSENYQSGLFDEIVVRDLIPYQYRRLQIDPSKLKEGYSLKKESFIVYPTYKSGHLIKIDSSGIISIKGRLVNLKGQAVSLQVGELLLESGQTIPFFTNKSGDFFIEGLNPGTVKFLLGENNKFSKDVKIDSEKNGLLNLGILVLNESE